MLGDIACAEGALAAGCRFFGGYPITPSTEIAERMAQRLPELGGAYVQMEDEIGSMACILGAAWGGAKSMTATSGPGISLMMENLGLGIITETPTVIINVQRAGPSTGLPTTVGQGDMMQARWGTHGPYEIIALVPWSAQECFDLTVRAFNLAERFRTPVLLMADAEVGHLTEKVVIPPAEELEITPRRMTTQTPEEFVMLELDADMVAPMAPTGEGYHVFVESLTHDERGYPVLDVTTQRQLVERLIHKIRDFQDEIEDYVEDGVEDAEVVVLSYGISARVTTEAVRRARQRGVRVGMMRLRTVWPFPEQRVRELSARIKGFVVPEINMGQIVLEVERCSVDDCHVQLIPHPGGEMHEPEEIMAGIDSVLDGTAPRRRDLVSAGA